MVKQKARRVTKALLLVNNNSIAFDGMEAMNTCMQINAQ